MKRGKWRQKSRNERCERGAIGLDWMFIIPKKRKRSMNKWILASGRWRKTDYAKSVRVVCVCVCEKEKANIHREVAFCISVLVGRQKSVYRVSV